MSLRDQLRGTGVALATPFKKQGSIDFDSLQKLINFVIEGGVEYVISLGTTGETPVLTREEKLEIVEFTYSTVNSRVPVVVGLAGNNTAALVKEVESFPLEKAVAVLTASPSYNRPSQEGIYQHYKALSEASLKPVILYNVPSRTGSNITAETTLRIAKDLENVCGIKEASGNVVQCMHIMRGKPSDFFVTSGDDHLTLPLIACGADGVISVAANCFPKDYSNMVRAALSGDTATSKGLHYILLEALDLMFAENNPAGVKAFLSELGIIENYLRLPLVPLSSALLEKVKEFLQQLK
jgi:4-hydroxy-tetrahydrodipicolinate synthase